MLPPILQRVKAQGYKVFGEDPGDRQSQRLALPDYDLNLVAVRAKGRHLTDQFDDMLCCVYRAGNRWEARYWPITTDPGKYYLETASADFHVSGTAILAPGQYRTAYKMGPHGSTKYLALVQAKPVTVFRDADRDLEYDHVKPETGWYGIHIHANSLNPYAENSFGGTVGMWSAGCQVFKRTVDFRELMWLCQQQMSYTGWKSYTYTLLED